MRAQASNRSISLPSLPTASASSEPEIPLGNPKYIQPLREGEEAYAMAFAVPINAKGLKILSQKSYEEGATSVFDNPLASRFDENDAVLYFDDVRVPWDRVFVSRNIAMCQKQFRATPAHVFHNYQSQTRLMVKMRFLVGIARRIAETNGVVNCPQVRGLLGSLAAQNTIVDALVQARISSRSHTLYSAQVLPQQSMPMSSSPFANSLEAA